MNILKSVALFLLLAVGLSSCIVAAPGYGYRRGPGFHHHHHGHYGGGGGHYGGGHYRR